MVTKLDRLARSLPDARAVADELTTRQISLSLGGQVYDPTDAVGPLLFNVLAMVAEFESSASDPTGGTGCGWGTGTAAGDDDDDDDDDESSPE